MAAIRCTKCAARFGNWREYDEHAKSEHAALPKRAPTIDEDYRVERYLAKREEYRRGTYFLTKWKDWEGDRDLTWEPADRLHEQYANSGAREALRDFEEEQRFMQSLLNPQCSDESSTTSHEEPTTSKPKHHIAELHGIRDRGDGVLEALVMVKVLNYRGVPECHRLEVYPVSDLLKIRRVKGAQRVDGATMLINFMLDHWLASGSEALVAGRHTNMFDEANSDPSLGSHRLTAVADSTLRRHNSSPTCSLGDRAKGPGRPPMLSNKERPDVDEERVLFEMPVPDGGDFDEAWIPTPQHGDDDDDDVEHFSRTRSIETDPFRQEPVIGHMIRCRRRWR